MNNFLCFIYNIYTMWYIFIYVYVCMYFIFIISTCIIKANNWRIILNIQLNFLEKLIFCSIFSDYLWVAEEECEVKIELTNPLPFELEVSNMVNSEIIIKSNIILMIVCQMFYLMAL